MADETYTFCARLHAKDGRVCGAGFLVDERHVISCAHVVNDALGLHEMSDLWPEETVRLDFPWPEPHGMTAAQVVEWHPPVDPGAAPKELADIAVLRLQSKRPEKPAVLNSNVQNWGGLNFEVAGFPEDRPNGAIVRGVTSGMLPGNRIQVEWLNQYSGRIVPGFSGAPVLANNAVIGMAFAADSDPDGKGYLVSAYRLDQAWLLATNPYKGLARFEAEDANMFFGRKRETTELAGRVSRAVVVVGPAGSGKSSLVFGGVLPKLAEAHRTEAQRKWLVASFRPGFRPMMSLVEALAALAGRPGDQSVIDRWLGSLTAEPGSILLIADQLRGDTESGLLLIADQMEEAFTLCKDDGQRRNFFEVIKEIRTVSDDQEVRARFLGSLRAEFLGHVLGDRILGPALRDRDYFLLRAIPRESLSEVIEEPADLLGVKFEEGLVRDLLLEAADNDNPLPLLEFALQRLWRHAKDRRINKDTYVSIGGNLRRLLTRQANETIDALKTEDEQKNARRLLCMLVSFEGLTVEAWSKRPRSRNELGPELWEMAKRLAGWNADRDVAPLVVIGRDAGGREIADLVHEGLVRSWQRLRDWIEEARELESSLRAVKRRLDAWRKDGERDEALLAPGYDLERGRTVLQRRGAIGIEDNVRSFIDRSIAIRDQQERRDALRDREVALTKNGDIARASREMLRVEDEAGELCRAVIKELGFKYATVQLVDKGERTIGTVNGDVPQGDWFGIANHALERDDPSLLDIQAHVASKPPKIEVIAGHDRRFDTFIFRTFGHDRHVRAFVPIILSSRQRRADGTEAKNDGPLGWRWKLIDNNPDVAQRKPGDKRWAYKPVVEQPHTADDYEIIGTIEAGFPFPNAQITLAMVETLVEMGHRHAEQLRRTTLQHVFETVVEAAHAVVKPQATYCGFAYNSKRERFEYEARAGNASWLEQSGLRGLYSNIPKMILIPNDEQGQDAYRTAYPEAHAAGLRAEALVPINVMDQDQQSVQLHGVLHLVFEREHKFYSYDKAYLESLASRAEEAIRLATAVARSRKFARGLRNLHHIASALAEQLEADEVLDKVAGYAMNMFASDLVTVYEYDQSSKEFRAEAGLAGRFKAQEQTAPQLLDRGSAPYALIEKGESQYENQLYAPEKMEPGSAQGFAAREGVMSVAGVILRTRAETVGVLFLNYRSPHLFSKEERDLAQALASTAAIAIRNRSILAAAVAGTDQ